MSQPSQDSIVSLLSLNSDEKCELAIWKGSIIIVIIFDHGSALDPTGKLTTLSQNIKKLNRILDASHSRCLNLSHALLLLWAGDASDKANCYCITVNRNFNVILLAAFISIIS